MDLFDYAAADKSMHAAYGAITGWISAKVVKHLLPTARPWVRSCIARVPVVTMAVGKEWYDARHGDRHDADWRDAAATMLGGEVAIRIEFRW